MCDSYSQEQQRLKTQLRNMTNPELIRYANTKPAASVLEKELVERLGVALYGDDYDWP